MRSQVETGELWDLQGEPDPAAFDAVSERMLAVVFYVAAALVDEPSERQNLLEELNPLIRLERVSEFVARLIGEIDPDREMLN